MLSRYLEFNSKTFTKKDPKKARSNVKSSIHTNFYQEDLKCMYRRPQTGNWYKWLLLSMKGMNEWKGYKKSLAKRIPTHWTLRCWRLQVHFWSLYCQVTHVYVRLKTYRNPVVVPSKQWIRLTTKEYLQELPNCIVPNLELHVYLIITG